ncbi:alpha-amylase family glycosyl hydrolase [Georgenia sp. TF02-10]|uniref:alpha-amylase family glycosyl hydrolase n=1 Tax=Georgenia sp. TF02-10 TaxID=2917725 RepID=UPI001FA6E158|nr:alpha-amylase family glycosyl hydrolase [Georgenia sp. TF02-10]UNX53236.1 alpha-amylase family glycosyl hydrolase [Georgenia sp. TF02-10]
MSTQTEPAARVTGAGSTWSDAIVYEVYLRSFADGDGDGVGDLPGLAAHLSHLRALGVDAVWLTPFFPSPGHDHGYDVSDYTDVDTTFGGLAAFEELVAAAHAQGLRVLVDVVPNHTSHRHRWFRAALAEGRSGGRYRDYYLWRDPAADGGPPNNWLANFGGPAWTLDPASGQYYYHAYLPEQPDLNWRNPEVLAEWVRILELWLARGADGFRIDVAHNLLKHAAYPDNPELDVPTDGRTPVGRVSAARRLVRAHDVDQDGAADIFAALRAALPLTNAGEPPFLLGETVLDDPDRVARYVAPGRLHAAMWFGAQNVAFNAADIAAALEPGARPLDPGAGRYAWFLSNHDRARPASRLAEDGADRLAEDGAARLGADRALAVAAVLMVMPGPYVLYQGEELGAVDADVPVDLARDPIAVRAGEAAMARDRARTPMPWTAEDGRGFSAATPWLPHGQLPPAGSVADQSGVPDSHLERWRSMVAAWRAHRGTLPTAVEVLMDLGLVRVRRGPLTAVLSTGPEAPLPAGTTLWRSLPGDDDVVRPGETVWRLTEGRSR